MATINLNAESRTDTGKGAARRLRRADRIPGVLYGKGAPTKSIIVDPDVLEKGFRKTMDPNTLINLDVEGNATLCLVKAVQRHPVSRQLRHVDFYVVDPDKMVQVAVRLNPVGTPEGVRMGGKVKLIRRTVDVTCMPTDIPENIDVDVAELAIDHFISVSEIESPEGCTIDFVNDFKLVTVVGKREEEEEEEEVETDEEGAEGEDAEGSEDSEG